MNKYIDLIITLLNLINAILELVQTWRSIWPL